MKTLILFILLLPIVAISQTISNGSKRIIIKTDLTDKDNFTLVSNALFDKGFDIHSSDNNLLTIRTQDKLTKNGAWSYYLNVRAMGNRISISGKVCATHSLHLGGIASSIPAYFDIELGKP